ncbi:MAG: glycerol-3-phosphate 1-O-acyltransferase PlsY [Holosporales bacterium]|jgi:glycerol-3-phosphate acyltransferase PlsY|nr:glycerol-3-phosphate 1-O-acyltransferase PlsY [Holosporales bacterium]
MTEISTQLALLIAALAGYLIGSIPSGVIFSKWLGKGDIRQSGSGSTGATNALRTQGKLVGALTLAADLAKGVLAYVLIATLASQQADPSLIIVFKGIGFVAPVLGHIFPFWLGFHGGKGVATALGVTAAACPWLSAICLAIWVGVFLIFKISSVASISSVAVAPVILALSGCSCCQGLLYPCLIVSVLIFYKHKDNIIRICSGTEKRITK